MSPNEEFWSLGVHEIVGQTILKLSPTKTLDWMMFPAWIVLEPGMVMDRYDWSA